MKSAPLPPLGNPDRLKAWSAMLTVVVGLLATNSAAAQTITTVASFNGANGQGPDSKLTLDAAGNLYGTTSDAGLGNAAGTVFELAKGSGTITALTTFHSPGAESPYGGATFDAAGNLYGTTYQGLNGFGSVFELAKGSGMPTVLTQFNSANGANPYGRVTFDAAGNLYGTTYYGGAKDVGTVFELTKSSSYNTLTTLASFDGTNGANPKTNLTFDAAGNLYGTTYSGGANGTGAVFELTKGSNYRTFTTLASFDGTNGANPTAGVTLDAAGNLYGTTYYGGAHGDGAVFEIARCSGTITALASFDGTDGSNP
jgi:uncharacterized repeat protein (TIGR03803 family)